jgi:hypothetical protein
MNDSNIFVRLSILPLTFVLFAVGGCPVAGTPIASLRASDHSALPSHLAVGAEMWLSARTVCGGAGSWEIPICVPLVGDDPEIVGFSVDDESVMAVWQVGDRGLHIKALSVGTATIMVELLEDGVTSLRVVEEIVVSEVADVQVTMVCDEGEVELGADDTPWVVADVPLSIHGKTLNEEGDILSLGMVAPERSIAFSDWVFLPEHFSEAKQEYFSRYSGYAIWGSFTDESMAAVSWDYAGFRGEHEIEVRALSPENLEVSFYQHLGPEGMNSSEQPEVYEVGDAILFDYGLVFSGSQPCNPPPVTLKVQTPEVCERSYDRNHGRIEMLAAGECRFTVATAGDALSETVSVQVEESAPGLEEEVDTENE